MLNNRYQHSTFCRLALPLQSGDVPLICWSDQFSMEWQQPMQTSLSCEKPMWKPLRYVCYLCSHPCGHARAGWCIRKVRFVCIFLTFLFLPVKA